MPITAFRGADGPGKWTTGGRGAGTTLYRVTNLNNSGAGSLRAACEASGKRIVIFEVSGTIVLLSDLWIDHSDITILGQTAPGHGITLRDYQFKIRDYKENIIIRYIRSRMGDQQGGTVYEGDAFGVRFGKKMIIDHCSFSWSTDELLSAYGIEDLTVQWCLGSEPLAFSKHGNSIDNVPSSPHNYGGIWGGKNAGFHHNLMAQCRQRMPRCDAYVSYSTDANRTNYRGVADIRNNVFYDWFTRAGEGGESGPGSQGQFNFINNYFKPGPQTSGSADDFFLRPAGTGLSTYGRFYISGNKLHGIAAVNANNRLGVGGISSGNLDVILVGTEFNVSPYDNTQTADECYDSILDFAGASLYRDSVDTRTVNNVINGTGIHPDSQADVGGWPTLTSTAYPTVTSGDGIPNSWKTSKGLNTATNYTGVAAPSGYDWIEEYAMDLVKHISEDWNGPAVSTYTVTLQANPIGGGTGTDLTNTSPYLEGAVVQVRAIANPGYEFVNWTRNGTPVSTSATFNFTVLDENSTLIANFNLISPPDPDPELPPVTGIKIRMRTPSIPIT